MLLLILVVVCMTENNVENTNYHIWYRSPQYMHLTRGVVGCSRRTVTPLLSSPGGAAAVLRSARLHVVLEDVEGCSSPRRVWCEKNRFVLLFGSMMRLCVAVDSFWIQLPCMV